VKHTLRLILVVTVATLTMITGTEPVSAQTSAAEMLEQARARARDIEEMKTVLNGPDQNMRLATFDVMVASGDDAMRQVALDVALASADPLMQAMAFKETVLSLQRIVMSIEIDTSQPQTVQDKAQALLNSTGSTYTIPISEGDRKTGTFKIKAHLGQVNGTTLTFKNGHDDGTLSLVDETTIRGQIRIYRGGYGGFIATAKLR